MSTYNGERYLLEQLESIRLQDGVQVSLRIRDDGSTDGTIGTILAYMDQHPEFPIFLDQGKNLGVLGSFMTLVTDSDGDSPWFAFADQDDVWFRDKLIRGIKALREQPDALLYGAAFIPVDASLGPLSQPVLDKRPGFANAIVENIATGCTEVFGPSMRKLALEADVSSACLHDWWFYLLATGMGNVVYDNAPCMYYRQHSSNVIGSKDGFFHKWRTRFRRFDGWSKDIFRQGELLLHHYGHRMSKEKVLLLEEFMRIGKKSFLQRLIYVFKMPVYRQQRLDQFLLDLLLVVGRIR